jgi:hypothetical protein
MKLEDALAQSGVGSAFVSNDKGWYAHAWVGGSGRKRKKKLEQRTIALQIYIRGWLPSGKTCSNRILRSLGKADIEFLLQQDWRPACPTNVFDALADLV